MSIMAPQIMSNYLTFTHEQWDWLMKMSSFLSKREYGVLLAIIRYTHGFHRTKARLSGTYLQEACGIWATHVPATLRKLQDKDIIKILPKEKNTNMVSFDWEKVLNTPTKSVGVDTTKTVGETLPKRLQTPTKTVVKPYQIGREESKEENKEENKEEKEAEEEMEAVVETNASILF